MLLLIGTIIYSTLFLDLLLYFLIAGVITIGNYFLLERIERYKEINQITVFSTLFLRYMIYVIVAFLVIWLNKDSANLEFIGISLVTGFSIIQIATIINALTSKSGVR
ncbi:hypothetical protein [Acholeplasma laidlawii]|uniref:Integral membrane protein n=2 Tax=Acholeplasma laidlawii TaxID=2148 RepID=A9NGW9_ACHLI|nr:hypothetical protein [Acholeplasma laidlawii]ABX81599.1 integral membrane protein [Acholeplasma laidlawii PG-8A]OAN20382.1 hypothetical protein A2I99_01660 [Acholeplasma laidlawii]OED27188.1 hypothetical protein A9269_05050 [Acholeplasma laidlawii]OED28631.1 hypothetical protein A9268_04405 [Acholeplasma laidlawii]OWU87061.1 hypothetical protein A8G01_05980 [Acholeplasma laidlawii]